MSLRFSAAPALWILAGSIVIGSGAPPAPGEAAYPGAGLQADSESPGELLSCPMGSGESATKDVGASEDSLELQPPQAARSVKVVFQRGAPAQTEPHTLTEARVPAAEVSSSLPPGRRTLITMSYAGCAPQDGPVTIYQEIGNRLRPLNTRVDSASETATAMASDFARDLPDLLEPVAAGPLLHFASMAARRFVPTSRFVLGTP